MIPLSSIFGKYGIPSILLLLCYNISLSQNIRPRDILGQSPQASALGKFLTIPVGYYTGIPETNVPVYTIKTKNITLPISLNYHGGGIKVEEVASNVGLGWTLSAGGAIIQQVRGLPDQRPGGYLDEGIADAVTNIGSLSSSEQLRFGKDVLEDESRDTESDMYLYSFNGESGKFFFDKDGKTIVTIPLSKNRISFNKEDLIWEITANDGAKYVFSQREEAITVPRGTPSSTMSTNWYLTRIVPASKSDPILFHYRSEYVTHNILNSEVSYRSMGGLPENCVMAPASTMTSYVNSTSLVLNSIEFPDGMVKFIKNDTVRNDLNNSYAVKSIEVYDKKMTLIKKMNLTYSYGQSADAKRLYLDKFSTLDLSSGGKSDDYQFFYESKNLLPHQTSYSQDFWGYFNGANNQQLIPTLTLPSGVPGTGDVTVNGANREPSPLGLAGTLVKMKFPSGGFQEFEYEPNRAYNMTINVVPKIYLYGGGAIHGELDENNERVLEYSLDFFLKDDNMDIEVSLRNGPAYGEGAPGPVGRIYDSTGNNVLSFPYPVTKEKWRINKKGNYKFRINFINQEEHIDRFHFRVQLLAPPGTMDTIRKSENQIVGGFRLNRTKLTDPVTGQTSIKKYTYLDPLDINKSSGILPSKLSFFEYVTTPYGGCEVIKLSSNSNAPLTTTAGAPVGYSFVTEYLGESGEFGKNEYGFTSARDKTWTRPHAVTSREHHRGKLDMEKNYKYENGKYILVKAVTNYYTDSFLYVGRGFKFAGNQVNPSVHDIDPFTGQTRMYSFRYYDIEADRFDLQFQRTSLYEGKDTISVTRTFNYNPDNYLVSEDIQSDSKGNQIITSFRYSKDMVKKGELIPYQTMIDSNIISPIIEEEKKLGTTSLYLLKTEYYNPFLNIFVPRSTFLKNGNGILENRVQYLHDKNGNITEITKEEKLKSVYIWSYGNQLPVAEVKNTDVNTVETLLGGRLKIDLFAASNPSDLEIKNFIAPLNNLSGSMISYFTYYPLIGMSSSTDLKGQTTYFKYDGFQRLKIISDQKGNILKTFDYHYK